MFKRLTSLFITLMFLSSCICLTGCKNEENVFPELHFADESVMVNDPGPGDIQSVNSDLHEITVALPLSDRTVNLLMKLYYAKNHDLFPSDMSGADISIEYLDAINTPWVVNTITTTGTGETSDIIESLSQDGIVPDVFLASDLGDMVSNGLAAPLDGYLASDMNISASTVYLGALDALRSGEEHYGIPFYSTVYMLAGSSEYVPESGVPAYNISSDDLLDYLQDIPGTSSDGSLSVTRFYDAGSLAPFMGADYADSIDSYGLSSVTDSYGADPRVSRSCGMWLMNSSEFDTWSYYYPDGLYFVMLPSENVNAVVYPLCLSPDSSDPTFASGFASFICFDKDAQMLMRRLESLRGYFPPVVNRGVWDVMSSDSEFGTQVMLYEQYMNNAVYTAAED